MIIHNSVTTFSRDMQDKLDLNSHKGGWENCSISYLFSRMKEEMDELETSLMDTASPSKIISECADVANFAMMIADNIRSAQEHVFCVYCGCSPCVCGKKDFRKV